MAHGSTTGRPLNREKAKENGNPRKVVTALQRELLTREEKTSDSKGWTARLVYSQIGKLGQWTQWGTERAVEHSMAVPRIRQRTGDRTLTLLSPGTFRGDGYLLLLLLFSLTKSSEPSVSSSSSPDEMASVLKRTKPWMCLCKAKDHKVFH
jgi:hypothetical protein